MTAARLVVQLGAAKQVRSLHVSPRYVGERLHNDQMQPLEVFGKGHTAGRVVFSFVGMRCVSLASVFQTMTTTFSRRLSRLCHRNMESPWKCVNSCWAIRRPLAPPVDVCTKALDLDVSMVTSLLVLS